MDSAWAVRWLSAVALGSVLSLTLSYGAAHAQVTFLAPVPADAPEDGGPIPSGLEHDEVAVIDLASALNLGGVRNPQLLLARQNIVEAMALRQLAAARLLPSLHTGTSYFNHDGSLQQSTGNILRDNQSSLYLGAGAQAVGAGTVSIPGVEWKLNVSAAIYQALESRQVVRRRQFTERARENQALLRIGRAYLQMVRAEGRRAVALQNLSDNGEVVRLLNAYAKVGQGREPDVDRARLEFLHRQALLRLAERDAVTASARLAALLDLPPLPRLHPVEDRAVPSPAVPDPVPLPELLAIAVLNRPELHDQQAAIRQALLHLDSARLLPFSPTVFIGYSYGLEGGGSNLTAAAPGSNAFAVGAPRFGSFAARADFDAAVYWSLQNLGATNWAQVKQARANLSSANLELVRRLNAVRAEVAIAYGQVCARLLQIAATERAVQAISDGFRADFQRIRGQVGLPIELLDSLRLLAAQRMAYLDAILDYNEAEMDLYVALGQPPANTLARPVPSVAPAPAPRP